MKSLRTFCYTCCLLAAVMFCSPVIAAGEAPSQIRVGTLYASSGTYASISMPIYKGLKLWISQVNADGGVYVKPYDKKIPVKLISYDDQSSTATAATLYNRLITGDHVDILVSDSGSVLTSVAVPIAKEHKMLLFDQTGTSANFFSPDNPYIVQLDIPVSNVWPQRLAEFLKKTATRHGIHRVAIVYATNDFSGAQAHALHDYLVKKGVKEGMKGDEGGIKVVYFHGVPTSTSSYIVLLHRIRAAQPDAVIELGYPGNDIAFLRDLQASGLSFPMLFAVFPGLDTELLEKNVGAQAMLGTLTYVTANDLHYKPDVGMNIDEFKAAYHEKYGDNVKIGFNPVAGYTTGLIIQKALATTRSMDQLALRDAVAALSGKLVTLNGHFRLSEEGAQIGELMPIGQVQPDGNGIKVVPLYPQGVAHGKPKWRSGQ